MSFSPVENFRHFKPAGPVSAAFIRDHTSTIKTLRGPVGSGKSVATVYDGARRPTLMPACNDGVVRYKRLIAGTTYGQLERNLYPTWWRWLPKDPKIWTEGDWKGGGGRFASQTIEWETPRGAQLVPVYAEYIFAAIGELSVEEFFRGFEVTDIELVEMDQMPEGVIDFSITRLGRYPANGSMADALPHEAVWQPQLSGDLNAPDTDSWYYRRAEESPPEGFKQYVQPGGLSPGAENKQNLPKGYYERMMAVLSSQPNGKHLIKRMVHNQYAPSVSGEPVFGELFDEAIHLSAEPLAPLKDVPLTLGFDQGLGAPACVVSQVTPKGQFRVLAEVMPGRMSARRFADEVRREIAEIAPGVELGEVHYCDPAGFTGADKEDGEMAWAEIVAAELGITILPTETNEIALRLTVVTDQLSYMIAAGEPGYLLSCRCRQMRKGFLSDYMYEKRPAVKSQQRRPIKNLPANLQDANQYLILGVKGRYGAIAGPRDPNAPERRGAGRQRETAGDCVVLQAPVDFG